MQEQSLGIPIILQDQLSDFHRQIKYRRFPIFKLPSSLLDFSKTNKKIIPFVTTLAITTSFPVIDINPVFRHALIRKMDLSTDLNQAFESNVLFALKFEKV
jgi:hypothetical protein